MGIAEQIYYRREKEYRGLRVDQAKRSKGIEQEDVRLKRLVANPSFDNTISIRSSYSAFFPNRTEHFMPAGNFNS